MRGAGLRLWGTDMRTPLPGGRHFLAMALAIGFALVLAPFGVTCRTTRTLFVEWGLCLICAHWPAACKTERVGALPQPMANRNPLVEDEALAAPQAGLLWHRLQIAENAALQMQNIVYTLLPQKGRRLFAANAPGAEHGNLW